MTWTLKEGDYLKLQLPWQIENGKNLYPHWYPNSYDGSVPRRWEIVKIMDPIFFGGNTRAIRTQERYHFMLKGGKSLTYERELIEPAGEWIFCRDFKHADTIVRALDRMERATA